MNTKSHKVIQETSFLVERYIGKSKIKALLEKYSDPGETYLTYFILREFKILIIGTLIDIYLAVEEPNDDEDTIGDVLIGLSDKYGRTSKTTLRILATVHNQYNEIGKNKTRFLANINSQIYMLQKNLNSDFKGIVGKLSKDEISKFDFTKRSLSEYIDVFASSKVPYIKDLYADSISRQHINDWLSSLDSDLKNFVKEEKRRNQWKEDLTVALSNPGKLDKFQINSRLNDATISLETPFRIGKHEILFFSFDKVYEYFLNICKKPRVIMPKKLSELEEVYRKI